MKAFGELAERTHTLMCTQWESADYADRLADLMDENFALRRTLYGDPAIGMPHTVSWFVYPVLADFLIRFQVKPIWR